MRKNIISTLAIFILFLSIFSLVSVFALNENATRKDAYDSIAKAKEDMAIMEKEGFGVVQVNDLIIEASSSYEAQVALEEKTGSADYSNVVKKANEVGTIKTTAYEINDELKAIEAQLNELSKEQDMKEAVDIFNRAKKEFADERYDQAKEMINDCYDKIIELQATFTKVRAIYEASTASIAGFFVTNYITLIIVCILLIGGYFLFGKKIRRYFINKSIKKLELEKETLNELIRRSQNEYFTKKTLAESTYRIRISKFAELIRDINRRLPLLKVKLEKLEERKDRKVGKQDVERIVSREVEGIEEHEKKKHKGKEEGIMFKFAHSLGMAKTAEEKKEAGRRKEVIVERKEEDKKLTKTTKTEEEHKKKIEEEKKEVKFERKEEEKTRAKEKNKLHKFWVSIGFARTPEQKAAAEKLKREKENAKKKKEEEKRKAIEIEKRRKEFEKKKAEDDKNKRLGEEKSREESKKRAIELAKKRAEEEKKKKIEEIKQTEERKIANKKSGKSFWVSLGLAKTAEQKAKIKAEKERMRREEEAAKKRKINDEKRRLEEEKNKEENKRAAIELAKKKAEDEKKRKIEEEKRKEIQKRQAIELAKKREEERKIAKKKSGKSFWVSIGFARTPEQKAAAEKLKREKENAKKRKIDDEKRRKIEEIKRKELERQKAESERKRKIEDEIRKKIQRKQAIELSKKRNIEEEKRKKFEEIRRKELEKAKSKETKEREKIFAKKRAEEEKARAKERRKKAWANFWHSLGLKKTAEEKARRKAEKERIKKEKELQKKIREQINLAKKAKKQELTQ